MTRRNPPALVDPVDVVRSAADRQLGIASRQSLEQRITALERLVAGLARGERLPAVTVSAASVLADWETNTPPGPPTIAKSAAAGSTATISITGNDEEGIIVLVPGGTGIATGELAVITFALARPSTNYAVDLQEFSAAARTAGSTVGPTTRSVASWRLTTGTALSSGSTYQWFYRIGKAYA